MARGMRGESEVIEVTIALRLTAPIELNFYRIGLETSPANTRCLA